MTPELLRHYSQELQHVREMGAEFARDFPKVAARLGLDGRECADPYVERLLEGFSFLAARVQVKLDAEFPQFTQHLAELVYPHYLAPTPSMAVVQIQPDLANPALAPGVTIPRGAPLYAGLDKAASTRCEYRTAHALTLAPVEIVEARFFTLSGVRVATAGAPPGLARAREVTGGLRLKLRATAGLTFAQIALDRLVVYLRGADDLPERIHERLFGSVAGVAIERSGEPGSRVVLPASALATVGFEEDEALLPVSAQSFPGYRLLQEYFALPQRFLFFAIEGLRSALRHAAKELDIVVLLCGADDTLERVVDASHFALHCTPVVNLFERRADRIAVSGEQFEYHVLPDRARPLDFEVHQVLSVTGYRSDAQAEQHFEPFYRARDLGDAKGREQGQAGGAWYQVRREKRLPSARQRERGARSSYLGSETFIALVDTRNAPYHADLRQLGFTVRCTNRDLPMMLANGRGSTDFTLDAEAPVERVRCLEGPSEPQPSLADGAVAWRLLGHLALNYASLVDPDAPDSARALRDLLTLYCPAQHPAARRQIDALRAVQSRAVTRRLPDAGAIAFGRGLEVSLLFDESGGASGAFLLGAVLARFFRQYVTLNSFAETVVKTAARGELMRWPARRGTCPTL